MTAKGFVLDAGAFIAMERGDGDMVRLARRLVANEVPLVTSAGVVAQVWRGGRGRQARLAFLLTRTEVVDLSARVGRTLGIMLGASRRPDPIDAHVVLLARENGWPVLTSDPEDLRALDASIALELV